MPVNDSLLSDLKIVQDKSYTIDEWGNPTCATGSGSWGLSEYQQSKIDWSLVTHGFIRMFCKDIQSFYQLSRPQASNHTRVHSAASSDIFEYMPADLVHLLIQFVKMPCEYYSPEFDPVNFITEMEIKKCDELRLAGVEFYRQYCTFSTKIPRNVINSNKRLLELAVIKHTAAMFQNPNDYRLFSNRSLFYCIQGHFKSAIADAYHCLYLRPTFAKAWLRLGQASEHLFKLERLDNNTKNVSKSMINNKKVVRDLTLIAVSYRTACCLSVAWDEAKMKRLKKLKTTKCSNTYEQKYRQFIRMVCQDLNANCKKKLLNHIAKWQDNCLKSGLHQESCSMRLLEDKIQQNSRKFQDKISTFEDHDDILSMMEDMLVESDRLDDPMVTKHARMRFEYTVFELSMKARASYYFDVDLPDDIKSDEQEYFKLLRLQEERRREIFNANHRNPRTWVFSWSCAPTFQNSKRIFNISICDNLDEKTLGVIIFCCIPHADMVIYLTQTTMAFSNWLPLGSKTSMPCGILFAHRYKDIYETISKQLKKYGIATRLENAQDALHSANSQSTEHRGWNHLEDYVNTLQL